MTNEMLYKATSCVKVTSLLVMVCAETARLKRA